MKKQANLLLFFFFLCATSGQSQSLTFQGRVVDTTNGQQKGIPYVNIGFPAYSIGTASNESGDFVIKIPQERRADTLVFSSIGYLSLKIAVKEIIGHKTPKNIVLKSNNINLDEFVVKSLDANKLIKMCLKNRDKNYATEPVLMQVFCREVMKTTDRDQYFAESEGILEVYKSSVKKTDDHVRLIKGRKKNLSSQYTNQNSRVFTIPEIVNAPSMSILLDIVKNPESFLLANNQFNFVHNGYESINDRLAYAIYFVPKDTSTRQLLPNDKDFYKGVIYLDTSSLAVVRTEFELAKRGIRANNLSLNFDASPLRLTKRQFTVNYAEYKNKWFFKSANVENSYIHDAANLLLTHKMENFVTEIKTDSVKKFSRKEEIGEYESLGKNITHFDDSFWGDYNFIKSNNESNDTLPKLDNPMVENPVVAEPKKTVKAPLIADNQSSKEVEFFHGSLKEAKKRAAAEKKYIFIDVYTTWCGPCKKMAAEAFMDEEVAELMNTFFINYKADAEAGGSSIAATYNVRSYPTTLIIDSTGAVVDVNSGYGGVSNFLYKMERIVASMPNGSFYLTAKTGYQKNKKNFNYILGYAILRRKLKMSNEPLTDDFVKNMPLDSFKLIDYQQFIYGYATQLDSKTFDFILKNREMPVFNLKLEQLIILNLNVAIQHKDKNLLKRIFKANERIINDPSVSAEKNEQLTLKYYEKTNARKDYHKAAVDLLTTYYLPQLNDATTKNIDTITNTYTTKIQEIGTYYSANIKDKKQLELMAELINKACEKHECPELISVYSQLLYRLGTVDKAKEWMTKALKLSGNAKDIADLLDKMQKGVF